MRRGVAAPRAVTRGAVEALARLLLPDDKACAMADAPWRELVALACPHGLASRLYRLLARDGMLSRLPDEERRTLREHHLRALQLHLLVRPALASLRGRFATEGIDTVPLKGVAFAERYYPAVEDRGFYDLDLLFRPDDRRRVSDILIECGYRKVEGGIEFAANAHKTEWVQEANSNVVVECHFGLGERRFALRGGLELPPLEEYLFLVFHAGVQHRFQNLIWLLDLTQMRARHGFDQAELRERAAALALDAPLAMIDRFAALGAEAGRDPWFRRLALRAPDASWALRARLRASLMGGWLSVADYLARRQVATWRSAINARRLKPGRGRGGSRTSTCHRSSEAKAST